MKKKDKPLLSIEERNNRLLSTEEVAELTGLNRQTVCRFAREGKIRHIKFGRHIRIRKLALEEFLNAREKGVVK